MPESPTRASLRSSRGSSFGSLAALPSRRSTRIFHLWSANHKNQQRISLSRLSNKFKERLNLNLKLDNNTCANFSDWGLFRTNQPKKLEEQQTQGADSKHFKCSELNTLKLFLITLVLLCMLPRIFVSNKNC